MSVEAQDDGGRRDDGKRVQANDDVDQDQGQMGQARDGFLPLIYCVNDRCRTYRRDVILQDVNVRHYCLRHPQIIPNIS